jgi:hypothetical protein
VFQRIRVRAETKKMRPQRGSGRISLDPRGKKDNLKAGERYGIHQRLEGDGEEGKLRTAIE